MGQLHPMSLSQPILIYSLENDLRALRILHDKIIDTAVVGHWAFTLLGIESEQLMTSYSHTIKVIPSVELSEICQSSFSLSVRIEMLMRPE